MPALGSSTAYSLTSFAFMMPCFFLLPLTLTRPKYHFRVILQQDLARLPAQD